VLAALLAVAALGSGFALIVGVGGARATTGTPEGLPEPLHAMKESAGTPFLGRFVISTVGRNAHVIAGVLDVAIWVEADNPFYYGLLQLQTYSNGKPMTEMLQVYPFEYSRERLSTGLIINQSAGPSHPYGITVGHMSFADPRGIQGVATRAKEIPNITGGKLTLNGRGPYQITFKRISTDGFVSHIPKAKLVG
jgi:hypothetical protein